MKIKTGLFGKTNKDILEGVMGQLSDGIWENSPRMGKYWNNLHISTEESNELCLEVPTYFSSIWNCTSSDTDKVKTWFADKIKQVVKTYFEDDWEGNTNKKWSKDNMDKISYFHGDYTTNTYPTVKDAYEAYKILMKGGN